MLIVCIKLSAGYKEMKIIVGFSELINTVFLFTVVFFFLRKKRLRIIDCGMKSV